MKTLLRFLPPAAAALVLFGATKLYEHAPLVPVARTTSIIAIILSSLCALFVPRPVWRSRLTVGFALAGATAAGQTLIGAPYAVLALFVVLSSVAAMRTVRSPVEKLRALRPLPIAVLAGVAGGIFALLAVTLPPASVRIERYFTNVVAQNRHAMGFGTTLNLGSMRGMLDSGRPVLEIEGRPVDYLRGAVLDDYDLNMWRSSWGLRATHPVEATLPRPDATTRVVYVPGARVARNEHARFFVPSNACRYGTASGRASVDTGGIVFPDGTGDESIWFVASGCSAPPQVLAPRRIDIALVPKHRAELERLSTEWTRGATTDKEKLAAIQRELSAFRYSVEASQFWAKDPILYFLTERREGYCEQFAAGMVLLARAQRIPARVVTGYRVPAANSITGRTIVRERNAHAWVEAWVEGAWHGYDPTPLSESMGAATPLEDTSEILGWAFDKVWDAIGNLSLTKTLALLAVLVVMFVIVRRFTTRRARARLGDAASAALPSFEALADALAKGGVVRDPSEPLESFARRLRAREDEWAEPVADVVLRYAAFRYGGEGDEGDVAKAALDAAQRVPAR